MIAATNVHILQLFLVLHIVYIHSGDIKLFLNKTICILLQIWISMLILVYYFSVLGRLSFCGVANNRLC